MAKRPGTDLRRIATRARLIGALSTALLVASPLLAQEETPSVTNTAGDVQPATSKATESVPSVANGWRIYRDPATGELLSSPLPGQSESLTAKWERRRPGSRPNLALRAFPVVLGGRTIGLGVKLDDRFVTSTVLIRNADGSETLACVDGPRPPTMPSTTTLAER